MEKRLWDAIGRNEVFLNDKPIDERTVGLRKTHINLVRASCVKAIFRPFATVLLLKEGEQKKVGCSRLAWVKVESEIGARPFPT